MLPPFALSLIMIAVCCFFVKPEPLSLESDEAFIFHPVRTVIYSVLFIISILAVFKVFPWYYALIGVSLAVIFLDFRAYGRVSYGLLLTFCAFFIFSGNVARIDAVKNIMEKLTAQNTLLTGVLSCQFISNVPTAVLLSRFTTDYKSLLVAVNIGGVGTIISSLASLITFGRFRIAQPGKTAKYLGLFSLINFAFLIALFLFEWLMLTLF